MPLSRLTLLASTVLLTPVLAQAQSAAPAPQPTTSPLATLLTTLVPIALLGLLFYWLIRRFQAGPHSKGMANYMTRHEQHMTRVEESLDRIAKALEKRNTP